MEYIVKDGKFGRCVSLIIANHTEGKEIINIKSYFLKVAYKFGFLLDFKFKRDKRSEERAFAIAQNDNTGCYSKYRSK